MWMYKIPITITDINIDRLRNEKIHIKKNVQ